MMQAEGKPTDLPPAAVTARGLRSLTAPPGQTINLRVSGYYSPSQALTSAAVDYAEQFAVYLLAGSAPPAVIADASGITGRG
jgi:hypothetical protein